MRHIKVLTALLLTLFTVSVKTFAQQPLSNQAEITLLTCGAGDELYSIFGHTAIRVYDPASRFDVVYNFGTFDFDTPNFYPKFVKGDLQYFVSASSYDDFIYAYQYYNRDVFEQTLNLTPRQKQAIANELAAILVSDRRFYTYKFIHRNCTTMVADIINKQIPQKISLKNADSGLTYRDIIHLRVKSHYFEDLGINLAFGAPTDALSQKLFLPKELMEGVSNTTTALGPLAKKTETVYKATPQEETFSVFNSIYIVITVCLFMLPFTGNKLFQRSFLAISGLLGLFFCVLGLYSNHTELIYNYNALLFNPLFLVLLYFIFSYRHKAVLMTSYACLAILCIYILYMLNKPHIIIILPLFTLILITVVRIAVSAKKAVNS